MLSFNSFCCSTCTAASAGVGPYVVVVEVQLTSVLFPPADVAVQLVFVVCATAADAVTITAAKTKADLPSFASITPSSKALAGRDRVSTIHLLSVSRTMLY